MRKITSMLLITMFLILSSIMQTGAVTDSQVSKAEDSLDKGNQLYAEKKLNEALQEYRTAQKLYPEYAVAYYNEGLVLRDLNKNEEAINALKKVVKINSNSISADYEIGALYEKMGNKTEADSWYNKAVELVPQSATGFFNHGNALKKLGRNEEAQEDYNQAANLDPKYTNLSSENSTNSGNNQEEVPQNIFQKMFNNPSSSLRWKLIIGVLTLIVVNAAIILFNKKRREKEQVVEAEVIDFVQKGLGIYTFTKEDSNQEEGEWYPKTRELLKTWNKVQLENAFNKVQEKFPDSTNEKVLDISILLDEELKLKNPMEFIEEENIFDDI